MSEVRSERIPLLFVVVVVVAFFKPVGYEIMLKLDTIQKKEEEEISRG